MCAATASAGRPGWRVGSIFARNVSTFDEFLREEGLLADAEAVAIERVVAYQLTAMMKEQRITNPSWRAARAPAARLSTGCLTRTRL